MKSLLQFAGYQGVWFAAVIGAGAGRAWPGVVAAAVFLAWQLSMSPRRTHDASLAALGVVLGAWLDGAFAASGWLEYAAPWPFAHAAPAWILALWAAFGLTFGRSLGWLQRHRTLAFALGAVFGPLAYLGAARGWGAVTFAAPQPRALMALAIGWGLATLVLAVAARWFDAPRGVVDARPQR